MYRRWHGPCLWFRVSFYRVYHARLRVIHVPGIRWFESREQPICSASQQPNTILACAALSTQNLLLVTPQAKRLALAIEHQVSKPTPGLESRKYQPGVVSPSPDQETAFLVVWGSG